MEVTFSSVEFNADLFAMANNETFETQDAVNPVTTFATVSGGKIVLENLAKVTTKSIQINGYTNSEADGAEDSDLPKFTVSVSTEGDDYTIAFTDSSKAPDNNTEVEVYYEQTVSMQVATFDNKKSAFGEVILKYPVYAGGDEDSLQTSNGGGIKGYVIMDIYRARATTMPGFDSNYKNTVENTVTFSTMDPTKAQNKNGKVYDVRYFDLDNSTGIVE